MFGLLIFQLEPHSISLLGFCGREKVVDISPLKEIAESAYYSNVQHT
jgi:hypothetical protein